MRIKQNDRKSMRSSCSIVECNIYCFRARSLPTCIVLTSFTHIHTYRSLDTEISSFEELHLRRCNFKRISLFYGIQVKTIFVILAKKKKNNRRSRSVTIVSRKRHALIEGTLELTFVTRGRGRLQRNFKSTGYNLDEH